LPAKCIINAKSLVNDVFREEEPEAAKISLLVPPCA
jgi:hypothetical protein